ncbi:ankyrin repeat and KH domain-containing protein 1-like [Haliotis rufescens]|uniref:ankyrin repeat and KH domain-containing protein 1-like n=1 Tax=Haliotis rufescens TaxID=6454 RepID=UPI00201EDE11|nr:ankyrin repeat and KH domain-containing protein 1-like [Haliotis rufescens]
MTHRPGDADSPHLARRMTKEQSTYSDMLMCHVLLIMLVWNVRADQNCPWGKYGDGCDKNCSDHCRISPDLGIIHCDRTSGRCSEGCIPGWYDDTCNKECSKNCINYTCNHQDGVCTRGCKDGEKGNFCEISGEEHETKGNDNTTPLWKIFVPVIVFIFVLLVFMVQIGIGGQRKNRLLKWPIPDSPLHKASAEGNLDRAKEIMHEDLLNANSRGSYGLTPLMLAALNGHYDVFEYLKQEGGDMTLKDRGGDHILSMACVGGNMDIVKYVVLLKPTLINKKRIDGRTALMCAACHGKKTVFEYLLDENALLIDNNDGDNILHYACHGGHIDIVKHIIDEAKLNINTRDILGRTALMIAATYGHKDVFELLVEKDSDISRTDKEGNNILHMACRGGHVKMVEHVLSQKYIDINCRGQYGGTPLMFAAFHGRREVFDLLMTKGANATLVCNKGNNLLHVACIGGYVKMVKHILPKGLVDIDSQGQEGRTPLVLAVQWERGAVFDLLVSEQASMVAKRKHHMKLRDILASKDGEV